MMTLAIAFITKWQPYLLFNFLLVSWNTCNLNILELDTQIQQNLSGLTRPRHACDLILWRRCYNLAVLLQRSQKIRILKIE
ncbi:hypothetical protein KPH14_003793 [Odynerus spinipes]|uniref:Uncharacterized protein n=1 Tax=Odynerus spinipes TaxID=1348599 RepID=A0AAD9VVP6_9HYME|nr:hypothetical protein KPH14_003793 [Odynerus spinipes]